MSQKPRVVIIGGGFAGLSAAQNLRRAEVEITLIDRRNYHLFQPLLYQVATGGLSPANIAAPLRAILQSQKNCTVVFSEVYQIDPVQKLVHTSEKTYPYDFLIVAAGATNNYFGHPEWEKFAPGLKTVEEATEIRRRVLTAFEIAEKIDDPTLRQKYLTFVVVGGGPTGIEMAGAISELARYTLRKDFRHFDPSEARVILVEGGPRLLSMFPEKLSARAEKDLASLGVEVWTDARVLEIQDEFVLVNRNDSPIRIDSHTIIWAAGVKASPLSEILAQATSTPTDRAGRIMVAPDLSLPNFPNIYAIGDMALILQDGKPVPGLAPAALQAGKYVARAIQAQLRGQKRLEPFRYFDKGIMATIGRNRAVGISGPFRFTGRLAWLAWLFIHLVYLIQFSNRVLVLFQWFWNYLTRNRSARLITHSPTDAKTFDRNLDKTSATNSSPISKMSSIGL